MTENRPVIYAFIDSQNLNLSIRNDQKNKITGKVIYSGWKLDYKRFFIYLKDKYRVSKAFLFIGKKKGNEGLYEYLERSGYSMVYKPTIDFSDGDHGTGTKGNIDAELVLQTMIELSNFDKAIIVAGDGDYHCLIKYLINQNKLKHILIPNKYSYSSLLKEFRHYIEFISDLKGKLEERNATK
jgi:uncharacterized LabA/DUF88 family protein